MARHLSNCHRASQLLLVWIELHSSPTVGALAVAPADCWLWTGCIAGVSHTSPFLELSTDFPGKCVTCGVRLISLAPLDATLVSLTSSQGCSRAHQGDNWRVHSQSSFHGHPVSKSDEHSPLLRAAEEFLRKVFSIECQDGCQGQLLSGSICISALRVGIIHDLA